MSSTTRSFSYNCVVFIKTTFVSYIHYFSQLSLSKSKPPTTNEHGTPSSSSSSSDRSCSSLPPQKGR